MNQFPTAAENIALDLIFHKMGEARGDRTQDEYDAIIANLPPIKVLHAYINDRLQEIADAGSAPFQICHFKAGDLYIRYEDFPKSVSIETVRSALVKIGMRQPRARRRQTP